MLLGGYLYAHATSRLLPPHPQAFLHIGLLATAFLALPVAIGADNAPPADGGPVLWMFGWLLARVGAPFLLLAATAPLLQHWLARSAGRGADGPYPLYSASNAGSLLGLLAFPALLEPRLTLAQQSGAWSAGYAAAVVLIAAAALAAAIAVDGSPDADRPAPALAAPRFRALEPSAGRHHAADDRRRRRAAPLGHAAGALSPLLRVDLSSAGSSGGPRALAAAAAAVAARPLLSLAGEHGAGAHFVLPPRGVLRPRSSAMASWRGRDRRQRSSRAIS